MGFFDGVNIPERPDRTGSASSRDAAGTPEWFRPPQWWLPGVVPFERMLLETEHVAVALQHVACFPTGLRFSIEVAVRQGEWSEEEWDEAEERFWDQDFAARRRRSQTLGGRLLFGVETADGGRAASIYGRRVRLDREPARPHLDDIGGGGSSGDSGCTRQIRLWLWPLPPPGPLDLVLAWAAFEVPETVTRLDADTFIAAAARATPYWDDRQAGPEA